MDRGSTGRPKLIRDRGVRPLTPLPLTGRDLTEDDLQELLDEHPDLLPIDEISSSWGPLVSLGREIGLQVGYIDNLFVSPAGELTLVEAKLWRNPQARREVVGQILDYAAAMASMSYEDLDSAVQASDAGPPIWTRLVRSVPGLSPVEEAGFVDTVSGNLHSGRFLLLVVGDGIRSDLHSMADLLGRHPTLGFHLELVELRVYAVPEDSDLLVVPSLVGRTEEVVRAVVEIRNPDRAEVSVTLEVPQSSQETSPKLMSLEDFAVRATETIGPARAEAIVALAMWWRDSRRGQIRLNKASFSFYAPRAGAPAVSVLTIYTDGQAVGSVASIATTNKLLDADEVLTRYQAAGFGGAADWPTLDFDPTVDDQRLRVTELLCWAGDLVAAAADGIRVAT